MSIISLFAKGCVTKFVGMRLPSALPQSSSRLALGPPPPSSQLVTARQRAESRFGTAAGPSVPGPPITRRIGHRFLCASQGEDAPEAVGEDDDSSTIAPKAEPSSESTPDGSLIARLVEAFPAFLGDLQASGALDMAEAADAPSKLEDRAQVKQCVLEFCRSRPDILFSLPAPELAPLAEFKQGEPNKKLRSALKRVTATYVKSESLGPSDGGAANFQDVVRIIMEMSFADAQHLSTIPDATVQAALDLLPKILELASAEPDANAIARAVEEDALRSGVPNPEKGKKDKRRERSDSYGQEDDPWQEFGGSRDSSRASRDQDGGGDWECSDCGQSNFARRTRCYGCGGSRSLVDPGFDPLAPSKEVKDGDWVCLECDAHNFSRRRSCFSCGIPRSEGDPTFDPTTQQRAAKPGEWICTGCGINNFFYRDSCYRCDLPRSEAAMEVPSEGRRQPTGRGQTDMRPGDWECPECNAHNFSRNQTCFKCDAEKPAGAGGGFQGGAASRAPRDMRPGDWECPECNAHNFSRNRACFRCDAEKPAGLGGFQGGADFQRGASSQGGRDMRPGDWECPECNAHNFARNRACFKCDADKPAGLGGFQGGADFQQSGRDMRPGDWECPECNAHNFARNTACFKCDADRPGNMPMSGEEQAKYGAQSRKGNWKCHECGFNNKGRDKYCQRCDTPAGSSGGAGWFEG